MGLQIDLFNWIGHWTYEKNGLTEFFSKFVKSDFLELTNHTDLIVHHRYIHP